MDPKQICQKAINNFGVESQIIIAIEEMSELQKELCKSRRGAENKIGIAGEIADVEIMLMQLKMMYDCESLSEKWKQAKLERLEKHLITIKGEKQ